MPRQRTSQKEAKPHPFDTGETEFDGLKIGDVVKHKTRDCGPYRIRRFCQQADGRRYVDVAEGAVPPDGGGGKSASWFMEDIVRPGRKRASVEEAAAEAGPAPDEATGEWARATRELLGVSRKPVAEGAGLTLGRLCAIETGGGKPPTDKELAAITAALTDLGWSP